MAFIISKRNFLVHRDGAPNYRIPKDFIGEIPPVEVTAVITVFKRSIEEIRLDFTAVHIATRCKTPEIGIYEISQFRCIQHRRKSIVRRY